MLISIAIMALGQNFGHRDGLLLSVALALGINAVFFFYGELRVVPRLMPKEIEGQDPWGVLPKLGMLCEQARIPLPKLYLIPSESPQSLVIGQSLKRGKIFLTEGLLERLNPKEWEAVLSFHVACIKNRSPLTFMVGAALADLVLFFGALIDKISRQLIGTKKHPQTYHIGTWLVSPLAAVFMRLAIGRASYLAADQLAVKFTGEPMALAQALWKLQSYADTKPFPALPSQSPLFVVNPLTRRGWYRYFHAQPSTAERIERLIGYFPI